LVKTSSARLASVVLAGPGGEKSSHTFLALCLAAIARVQTGQTFFAARLIGETLRVALRTFVARHHAEARHEPALHTATALVSPALAV
jgi:hypothetical protein